VHLDGFTIEIYYNARTYERQICTESFVFHHFRQYFVASDVIWRGLWFSSN